jgi:hypothetical protein
MKRTGWYFSYAAVAITALLLACGRGNCASDKALPLIHGSRAVAVVNGEPVTLADLDDALALRRTATGKAKVTGKETSELLERLINTRLALQEARKIGLDDLPEIKKMVDVFARTALREQLMERQVGKLTVPEKEVERLYREATKEWKLISVMFEKKDDAEKMVQRLKKGEDFASVAGSVVAQGAAKGGEVGSYLKVSQTNPQIAAVVSKMAIGTESPIIPLTPAGYAVVKLEDVRWADSPAEKERVREEALKNAKVKVLTRYNEGLIKQYAVVHKDVLKGLDFEAKKPGFDRLLGDRRVLAEIKGEKPITVGELADELRHQLYHGVEEAAESKKLNEKIAPAFNDMLYKRVFRKEALRLGLDKSAPFTRKVKEYEDSLVFGSFVQRVVAPEVKVTEEEVQKYYQEHIKDYTYPEMMKLSGIAFKKRADAEDAVKKLRNGTDFQWLANNAEDQVEKNSPGLLTFDGNLLTVTSLPEGLQKIVSGNKPGDLRLYASPEGYFYAVWIQDIVAPKPKPLEDTRREISKQLFGERLKQAMDEYVAKLRAAADIKVFLNP